VREALHRVSKDVAAYSFAKQSLNFRRADGEIDYHYSARAELGENIDFEGILLYCCVKVCQWPQYAKAR
jgi:hypothetical protein